MTGCSINDGRRDTDLRELREYVLDRIKTHLPLRDHPTAYDRLVFSLSCVTGELFADDRATVITTLMKLRSQPPNDERFRARFTDYDVPPRHVRRQHRTRIENGTLRGVDPEAVSEFLLSLMEVTTTRQVTTRGIDLDAVRAEAVRYVDAQLLATTGEQ